MSRRLLSLRSLAGAAPGSRSLIWTFGKEEDTVSYAFTEYFENKVLAKRPYLTKEMCIRVVQESERKRCKTTVSG